jgi:hypothetical protein
VAKEEIWDEWPLLVSVVDSVSVYCLNNVVTTVPRIHVCVVLD